MERSLHSRRKPPSSKRPEAKASKRTKKDTDTPKKRTIKPELEIKAENEEDHLEELSDNPSDDESSEEENQSPPAPRIIPVPKEGKVREVIMKEPPSIPRPANRRISNSRGDEGGFFGTCALVGGGLCLVVFLCLFLWFSSSSIHPDGDERCTYKGGKSYWEAVEVVQRSDGPQLRRENPSVVKALKDSLSTKKHDYPLILLLAGPGEAREDMFTASEWLASSLFGSNHSTGSHKRKPARASYLIGEEYYALPPDSRIERKSRFHSTVAKEMSACPKTLLAVDASLVVEFLDLLSPAVEDGAHPHLQLYQVNNHDNKEKEEPREVSTRDALIIFIASLGTQDIAKLKEKDPEEGRVFKDLLIGKVKENFKWEDRFCQRISHVIPF